MALTSFFSFGVLGCSAITICSRTPTLMKQKVLNRRKLVKKFAKQKMRQIEIAKKLDVSLSTIEKDISVLRN